MGYVISATVTCDICGAKETVEGGYGLSTGWISAALVWAPGELSSDEEILYICGVCKPRDSRRLIKILLAKINER